jgi:hypothetical protein
MGAVALEGLVMTAYPFAVAWCESTRSDWATYLPRPTFGAVASLAAIWLLWGLGSLAAAVLYCHWLYRAYEDNRRLRGRPLRFSPSHAVASFLIPVVNLWRPFQALRDLFVASDPRTLPDPPRYEPSREALYRSNAREFAAPPAWNKRFPVRAWWACYMILPWALKAAFLLVGAAMPMLGGSSAWLAGLLSLSGPLSDSITSLTSAASTVLALEVIVAIKARQGERLRRLEGSGELAAPVP